jgi:hypothetical protein
MDALGLRALSLVAIDPIERDLAEVDAAIALVTRGLATRVRLVGLMRTEALAGPGLARSQAAGVGFGLDSAGSTPALTVGPLAAPLSRRARFGARRGWPE